MAIGSCIFSLILLLATDASNVIDGSPSEDAVTGAGCPRLAPGLERMALGVDITKLDLFHDYTVDADDGFTERIITYTCAEGKSWDSPYDGKTYQIPDQIDEFSALSAGMVISKANVYSQKDDMKKEMAAEVGLDLTTAWASFSSSLTYKSSFQSLQTLNMSAGSSKAHVTVAQAIFAPSRFVGNSSLSKYFVFDIEDLPPKFESTSENRYFQLIRSYGTHFFHRANLGGSLSIWYAISKSLTFVMSSSELNVQAEASFLSILKAHGAYSGEIANVTEQFKSNSSHTERYFGGQANLFDSEGYKAWWSTVAGNPWLHSGSLVSITDLLADSNPKKGELLKAIEAYKLKTSVNETRTLIQMYQGFHPAYTEDHVLKEALHMLTFDNITLESLSAINREVQEHTLTPTWFSSNFKLCQSIPYQEDHCSPFGLPPSRGTRNDGKKYPSALEWRVDGPLDRKLFDIVWSNATFYVNQTVIRDGQWPIWVVDFALEVIPYTTPAWIRNLKFGARFDNDEYVASILLLDPLKRYHYEAVPGNTVTFFIVPAPL